MDILLNPIIVSVILMCVLCLMKINVLFSLLIAAITGGLLAGLKIEETTKLLVEGMGSNGEMALSYILLGTFAAALSKIGITNILTNKLSKIAKGRKVLLLLILAVSAILAETVIPIHIAFIPILVPSLIVLMNEMNMDRKGAACALAYGLKTPYMTIPVGYGLIFHGIVADNMTQNGMKVQLMDIYKSTWILGIAMTVGFILSMIVYSKKRVYNKTQTDQVESNKNIKFEYKHAVAIIAIVIALVVQVIWGSMPLGAIAGIMTLVIGQGLKIKDLDSTISEGIKLMGLISFIMLVAAGYGYIMKQTGSVDTLIEASLSIFGNNKPLAAIIMILVGLITTMGIGTSFGTVPILAILYVPMAQALGFSVEATIILIVSAAALGDAGSPASDTTLGPTSGLNIDGQHNHIWDTCVPTFIFYNIPIMIFGFIGAMIF